MCIRDRNKAVKAYADGLAKYRIISDVTITEDIDTYTICLLYTSKRKKIAALRSNARRPPGKYRSKIMYK